MAYKMGSMYYLGLEQMDNTANVTGDLTKEDIWHRRFGHLGERNLCKLAENSLVNGFDYDVSKSIEFCESCVSGKMCRSSFPKGDRERAREPLALVHSDVCGKISPQSLGNASLLLLTIYIWVYVLRNKHEVFNKFCEWKSLVVNLSGHKLKVFRTDNGGEYTSNEFEEYLRKDGIKHEYSIPKTPQQNGVSERMNRTWWNVFDRC